MAQLNRFHEKPSTGRIALVTAQALQSGKYRAALFGGVMMVTVLLGIYGCSKETSKPTTAAATPAASAQPAVPDPPAAIPSTPSQLPARKRPVQKQASLATYANSDYGVSFRYPKSYDLREGDEAHLSWPGSGPVSTDFVKPGGMTLAAVELPSSSHSNKDLTAAFVNVSVNPTLTSSECAHFAFPDRSLPGVDPQSRVKVGTIEFDEMEDLGEQGKTQADARYYHVFKNGACYEFALGLGTAVNGDADEKSQINSRDAFRKLENVLSRVRIKSVVVRGPETPADSRSPQPSPPASAPPVSAPPVSLPPATSERT
jgi:hypothetical protein